jgi:hypothetical protein
MSFVHFIDDPFRKLNSVGFAREWGMHLIQRFNMFKSRLPTDLVPTTNLWSICVHLHNLVARCEGNNHVQNTFYIAPDDGEVFSCGPICWCTRRQRAQVWLVRALQLAWMPGTCPLGTRVWIQGFGPLGQWATLVSFDTTIIEMFCGMGCRLWCSLTPPSCDCFVAWVVAMK